ncbi:MULTISPECIES: hemin ABC transporter substrate-binding protein [unclassified Gilliamella]|uniref:heme/hemin ABC transporter substrate-binding protein n=1 Tax=unclassified Gilliamella TaxID=2685620 RepID=UPI0018DD0DC6|nr:MULTISPECIES: ABC transporter substrate-binding protein [unclassified Gilliamella]MBI0114503.1 ABC transporter substrate-binding protein [Gilliamella sp. W8123]MBI0118128.1 ABC transporter substrate-binding protein [Gilliamella sp. W8129]
MKKKFTEKFVLFLLIFSINSLINFSSANQRIVIAGGALTEIVFALGAGDQVIGVDKTSSFPEKVKQLPQIGYWKLLNIEGILSLKPSLFITLNDVEPENIIDQVNQSKVDVLALKRVPGTIDLLYENINKIAVKLDKQKEGQALIERIKTNIADIEAKVATHAQKTKVLALMSMGGNNSVAGKNTTIDALITIAGGENLANHNSFKSYTAESLITLNPEVIILNKHSIDQLGGLDKVNTIPGITETAAFKNNRITIIDDSYLFGIGPRVDEAAKILFQSFYPQ